MKTIRMHKVQTICLIILATIAVAFSLAYLRPVLLPFVIALFIVIGIRPILSYVENRLNLHRAFATVVTFSCGVILMLTFASLVWASIVDLARHSDSYQERLNHIIAWVVEQLPDAEEIAGPSTETTQETVEDREPGFVKQVDEPAAAVEKFLDYVSREIQSRVLGLASSLTGVLSKA